MIFLTMCCGTLSLKCIMLKGVRREELETDFRDTTLLKRILRNARSLISLSEKHRAQLEASQCSRYRRKPPPMCVFLQLPLCTELLTKQQYVEGGGQHLVNNTDPLHSHSAHTQKHTHTLSVLQVKGRGGVCCCGSQVARCIPSTGSLWQPAQIPPPLCHSARLSLRPPIPPARRLQGSSDVGAPRSQRMHAGRERDREKEKALRGRARERLSNRGEKC